MDVTAPATRVSASQTAVGFCARLRIPQDLMVEHPIDSCGDEGRASSPDEGVVPIVVRYAELFLEERSGRHGVAGRCRSIEEPMGDRHTIRKAGRRPFFSTDQRFD